MSDYIRPAAVAGMFYPAHANELDEQISQLLADIKTPSHQGNVMALISPHAGYIYSGYTAAHAYTMINGKNFDCVVIVSPSHKEYFQGISVFEGKAYQTPLGIMNIDEELRKELVKSSLKIEMSRRGHASEHAIEVQLPFLQKVLGKETKILPIVMGDQRRTFCMGLSKILTDILQGKNILLIASTDLSHYHSYEKANTIDKRAIDDIARFDFEQLMEDLESNSIEMCGGGPTVSVLSTAKNLGATSVSVLHRCNSGDITGDHREVVGYVSAIVTGEN